MLTLAFDRVPGRRFAVLAIGAHPDDIEIGCGGTILRLVADGLVASARWVVLSGGGRRSDEARRSAAAFLDGVSEQEVTVAAFRDGFFPYDGGAIKETFEGLKGALAPDIIFTPRREDLHQDHRLVSELTWNTFRDHLILEYEIPKYEGDLGAPNLFVELTEESCRRKVDLLRETYRSQADKSWFNGQTFWAMLALRGVECRSRTRYAEGFTCRKARI